MPKAAKNGPKAGAPQWWDNVATKEDLAKAEARITKLEREVQTKNDRLLAMEQRMVALELRAASPGLASPISPVAPPAVAPAVTAPAATAGAASPKLDDTASPAKSDTSETDGQFDQNMNFNRKSPWVKFIKADKVLWMHSQTKLITLLQPAEGEHLREDNSPKFDTLWNKVSIQSNSQNRNKAAKLRAAAELELEKSQRAGAQGFHYNPDSVWVKYVKDTRSWWFNIKTKSGTLDPPPEGERRTEDRSPIFENMWNKLNARPAVASPKPSRSSSVPQSAPKAGQARNEYVFNADSVWVKYYSKGRSWWFNTQTKKGSLAAPLEGEKRMEERAPIFETMLRKLTLEESGTYRQ